MWLDSTLFFYLSTVGYFSAFIAYLLQMTARTRVVGLAGAGNVTTSTGATPSRWGQWASWITLGTVVISTAGIVLRTVEISRTSDWFMPLPVSNTYETLAFFSWAIPLIYLWFERRYRLRALGAWITGLAFVLIALASSPLVPQEVKPLVPALQSYWLVAHVSFTLAGEALFSIAFAAGIVMIWRSWRGTPWEELKGLDQVSYRAVALGFPLFTLGGLVFGAIWAQKAWGRYWGWDPKETWMLISWFIYALYLHARVQWSWKDLRSAWLIVIGYAATLFTWFGVNYVLSGLHSYN